MKNDQRQMNSSKPGHNGNKANELKTYFENNFNNYIYKCKKCNRQQF